MLIRKKGPRIVAVAGVGLLALMTLAGTRNVARPAAQVPVVTEITEPFVMEENDFKAEPLGWRNIAVTGGTVAAHASSSTVAGESLLTLTTDATHPVLEGSGEAGYRLTWTGSGAPPGPIQIMVSQSIGFKGTAGFIETTPANLLGRIDMSIYESGGEGGATLKDLYQNVTLTLKSDGSYGADIWLPTPSFRVERAPGGGGASVEFGIDLFAGRALPAQAP